VNPRLSVAMIVRDEAPLVPDFLEAATGLWDELVVVDTGSSDGTAALFEHAGARVIHSPWTHDFAAARNVSLAQATGDWVLVLDADERVSADFISQCRASVARSEVGALLVRVSNQLPYGHRRDAWLLRAWRRDDAVRYRYPVREEVSPDVMALLGARGQSLERIDAPVEHLGYVRDRDAARNKKARDTTLLRDWLCADPGALVAWLKLLEVARTGQDDVLWNDVAHEATDVLEVLGRERLEQEPWGGELIALIAEGLFTPESEAGLAFLDGWAERLLPSNVFLLRRGFFLEHQGRWDEAREDYEACLRFGRSLADPQLAAVGPRLGLARLALARHEPATALGHSRQALEAGPREPEALMAVATLTRHLEGRPALDGWLRAHELLAPACPERDWAAGEALLASGEHKAAASAFRRAAGVPPGGPAGLRLAQAMLACGQLESSEQLARQLLATQPEAGLGLLLFDLAAGRDTSLDLELTPETAHAALKQWVDVLLSSQQRLMLRRVRARVGAVGMIFPWLPGYLLRKSA
jgi:glycosyltransferase involved in cell wall biosynthesis